MTGRRERAPARGLGRAGRRRRGEPREDRALPATVEHLCREYAAVGRAIWERERERRRGGDGRHGG